MERKGKKDELVGRIQKAYGITREEARKQVEQFETQSRKAA